MRLALSAREFYHRVWRHYQTPEAWNWQKREEYGNKGQGTPAIDGVQRTMWIFEPHVAEQVFEVPGHEDDDQEEDDEPAHVHADPDPEDASELEGGAAEHRHP